MRRNALLIVFLPALVIAAPVVDAIACDDCEGIIPLRAAQQSRAASDHSAGKPLSSDADSSAPQETDTAQDLCPICANTADVKGNACCGTPAVISQKNQLPKLLALSAPSYPINKPPQN